LTTSTLSPARLESLFGQLYESYGPQHWWPGSDRPFTVMVGAILTQNTAWRNVEKAVDQLAEARALDPESIDRLPMAELATLIRPSGYFNIKADRLKHLAAWFLQGGGFERLKYQSSKRLRQSLLAVKGVGPETCDDILLYAFHRPVFVVDAYTFRIFERVGLIGPGHDYESLRAAVEQADPCQSRAARVRRFNELHALIVRHGNQICRPRPHCGDCALAAECDYNLRLARDS